MFKLVYNEHMKKEKTYWTHPEWYMERAKKIAKDKANGMTTAELVAKYKVSTTAIYRALHKLDKENNG